MRQHAVLFLICVILYSFMNYGGIRSPDSEVVYRVAESIADSTSFSPKDLEFWGSFGASAGIDGKLYSVYPPLESLLITPVIIIGRVMNQTGWYHSIQPPVSHYSGGGLETLLLQKPLQNPDGHALRCIVSFADVIISVLTVSALYAVLLAVSGSVFSAFFLSLVYAFGTIAWSYAGSVFSEPMATLWVLLSFYGLLKTDPDFAGKSVPNRTAAFGSGVLLGLAVATHYTAFLFLPFFLLYIIRNTRLVKIKRKISDSRSVIFWLAGLSAILCLLGYYNFIRFGDFFQSGRELSLYNRAEFVPFLSPAFWQNLYGLMAGAGKGFLLFCPAAVLCFFAGGFFRAKHTFLFHLILLMVVFRILFIAAYKDWHGGFCLGPRYLFMIIPFMLIPAASWISVLIEKKKPAVFNIVLFVACAFVIQQLYFAVGEIFIYYHSIRIEWLSKGIDVFLHDRIYLDWTFSPIGHLHHSGTGPWIISAIGGSALTAWTGGSLLVVLVFALLSVAYARHCKQKIL